MIIFEFLSAYTLQVIKGDLQDEDAIQGQNVVVSFLGPESFKTPPGTYTNAYKCVFNFMRQHGVKRILVMGTFSITDIKDQLP